MVAVLFDDSEDGTLTTISGGSTWNRLGGGTTSSIPGLVIYHKVTGAGEPTNYTVSYAGATSSESAASAMIEILGSTTGLVGFGSVANSNTTPALSVSTAGSIFLACASGIMTQSSVPSGFTSQVNEFPTGASPTGSVLIASLVTTTTGTVTPGAWGLSSTANNYLWSLLFGC